MTGQGSSTLREQVADLIRAYRHGSQVGYFDRLTADAVLALPSMRALVTAAEWQCPNCGATTRARMADHEDGTP